MLFVGVDGHKNTSQITVMDAAGKILKRQRVLSSLQQFRQSLAEFSEPMKDNDDGLYGFELKDADGYVVFFGRPR